MKRAKLELERAMPQEAACERAGEVGRALEELAEIADAFGCWQEHDRA